MLTLMTLLQYQHMLFTLYRGNKVGSDVPTQNGEQTNNRKKDRATAQIHTYRDTGVNFLPSET